MNCLSEEVPILFELESKGVIAARLNVQRSRFISLVSESDMLVGGYEFCLTALMNLVRDVCERHGFMQHQPAEEENKASTLFPPEFSSNAGQTESYQASVTRIKSIIREDVKRCIQQCHELGVALEGLQRLDVMFNHYNNSYLLCLEYACLWNGHVLKSVDLLCAIGSKEDCQNAGETARRSCGLLLEKLINDRRSLTALLLSENERLDATKTDILQHLLTQISGTMDEVSRALQATEKKLQSRESRRNASLLRTRREHAQPHEKNSAPASRLRSLLSSPALYKAWLRASVEEVVSSSSCGSTCTR
jgi:hypothetical protein